MARMRRSLVTVILALMVAPTAAVAHSAEVEVDPTPGATLTRIPAVASVTFDEAPKQADVVLATPDGTVRTLTTHIDGPTVTVRLPSGGPRGKYRLSYRVVSADGHPVSGTATFTVTTGPRPHAAPVSTDRAQTVLPIPMIAVLGAAAVALVALALVAARVTRR
jgi:methionine-rich copper-binding protein CopC